MNSGALTVARLALARMCTDVRAAGASDREVAEWLLSTAVRYMRASGMDLARIHAWVDYQAHTVMPLSSTPSVDMRSR